MEDSLHKRVISQHEAVTTIAKAVRRSRAGLKDPRRPIGSFIFLGPTGVGKTLLAKALAEFMFGDQDALIQIDMSEYMEKHAVSRLVGAPPGYVGYEEGGQLTEKIRRRPYSVVLLDEIEKAHPEIFNILLQIMEDGKLTDSYGRHVDFRNTIIIMTSNVGAKLIKDSGSIGFGKRSSEASYSDLKRKLIQKMEEEFRPEFIARLDDVIVFHHLTKDDISKIVHLEVAHVSKRLREKEINLVLSDVALDFLMEKGTNLDMGARPLRRAVEKFIEDPLSEEILRGTIPAKSKVEAIPDVQRENLVFRVIGEFQPEPVAVGAEPAASGGTSAPPSVRGGSSHGGGAGAARS
jgi:ATP-dependent Clp protease ATP-binding subunit ClpC